MAMPDTILDKLREKSISRDELAKIIINDPSMIPQIIEGVSNEKANVRYGCATSLKIVSERKPELLYPYFDFFAGLLISKYRILVWIGIIVVANLSAYDHKKKFDKIFDKYFRLINADYMVTVSNLVGNSGRIAVTKPYLADRITTELLKVDNIKTGKHLTPECKRIIAENAIRSFDMYFNEIRDKQAVISFVKARLKSRRKTLKNTANEFLKKWNVS